MKKIVTICLDEKLLGDIDEIRGLASRSAYIENMLRSYLYGDFQFLS